MIKFNRYEEGSICLYRSTNTEHIGPCLGKGNRDNFLEKTLIDRQVFKKYSIIISGIRTINFDNSWWCASEKDARMLLKNLLDKLKKHEEI